MSASVEATPRGIAARWQHLLESNKQTMEERRAEPRTDVQAPAVMTPLAAVSIRVEGQVVNVSPHGVKVRVAKLTSDQPRIGDVYRILSGRDLMLCEVSHWLSQNEGAEIGFRIVHWSDSDELKRVATEDVALRLPLVLPKVVATDPAQSQRATD